MVADGPTLKAVRAPERVAGVVRKAKLCLLIDFQIILRHIYLVSSLCWLAGSVEGFPKLVMPHSPNKLLATESILCNICNVDWETDKT